MLGLGFASRKRWGPLLQRAYFFSSATFTFSEASGRLREAIFLCSVAALFLYFPRFFGSLSGKSQEMARLRS